MIRFLRKSVSSSILPRLTSHSSGEEPRKMAHRATPQLSMIGRLLSVTVAVMAALITIFWEAPSHPVQALGPGEVCVFLAESGAHNLGHVGWAFRVDQQDLWIYGAVEGPVGAISAPTHGDNGAWIRETNWDTMIHTFVSDLKSDGSTKLKYGNRKSTDYHPEEYYTQFSCKDTSSSDVHSAESLAYKKADSGYNLITNSCWTQTFDILSAYAPDTFSIKSFPIEFFLTLDPNNWFKLLGQSGFGPFLNLPHKECSFLIFFCSFSSTPMPSIVFPSAANVSITPASRLLQKTYTITAVTGTPNPDALVPQIDAHILTATTAPVTKTVGATGQGTTPGTEATGFLTFTNGTPQVQSGFSAGDTFTGSSGVTVVLDASTPGLIYPGASYTEPAHASIVGTAGNIPELDIETATNECAAQACVTVVNYAAFTGGTSSSTYPVVQQSDIDNAANALIASNTPGAQQAQQILQAQVPQNEPFIGTPQCHPNTSADHAAGDQATQVTVTVSFTCSGEVYDHDGALKLAQKLLTHLGGYLYPTYASVGDITTTMQNVALTNASSGTVTMMIHTSGMWRVQFLTPSQQALAQTISGMSKSDAQALLIDQPGIKAASIQLSGGNVCILPPNPNHITVTILNQ